MTHLGTNDDTSLEADNGLPKEDAAATDEEKYSAMSCGLVIVPVHVHVTVEAPGADIKVTKYGTSHDPPSENNQLKCEKSLRPASESPPPASS